MHCEDMPVNARIIYNLSWNVSGMLKQDLKVLFGNYFSGSLAISDLGRYNVNGKVFSKWLSQIDALI